MTDSPQALPPRHEVSFPNISTKQFLLWLGMVSMSMVFLASLVAYFITRHQSEVWRTEEVPQLPWGLWVSTLILFVLSGAMHRAKHFIRQNQVAPFQLWLNIATLAVVAFLGLQAYNWRVVASEVLTAEVRSLYSFSFYLLTVIHAIHVVGGFVPQLIVKSKAKKGIYTAESYEGVGLLTQYWDFLLIVWLVLLPSVWFF
ncbi:MAG: hypothetical protein MK135_01730 [Polyangiaceae bacterium]|nr:hypothetical protein [Polyangiaceae bacterium]